MNNDAELLRRYVVERSESAFSSLVTNYLNLVYATALRELRGDRIGQPTPHLDNAETHSMKSVLWLGRTG